MLGVSEGIIEEELDVRHVAQLQDFDPLPS